MRIEFKNFVNLTEEEIKAVWQMRNSDSVRLKMYTQDIIPLENHKKWVSGLSGRSDCIYFLVLAEGEIAGCVNFTSISARQCEWGYYLNPEIQNGGLGIVLEYYAVRYAFENLGVEKLFGAVIESNPKLYRNHIQYFGFSEDSAFDSERMINGNKTKFKGMSLRRQDWENWNNPLVLKWITALGATALFSSLPV